jgi:hypothetical protein
VPARRARRRSSDPASSKVSAANADAVETQPQKMQRDPPAYRAFVEATARLARGVKPDVQVMSGLSTHPGYPATTEMLRGAWASVRDVVDGHYLSLGRHLRHPDVAAACCLVCQEVSVRALCAAETPAPPTPVVCRSTRPDPWTTSPLAQYAQSPIGVR